jgi:hypothetical protein
MKITRLLCALVLPFSITAVPHHGAAALERRQLLQNLGLPKGLELSNVSPSVLSSLLPLIKAATAGSLDEFFGGPDASEPKP